MDQPDKNLDSVIQELLYENTKLRLQVAILAALAREKESALPSANLDLPEGLTPEVVEALSTMDIR